MLAALLALAALAEVGSSIAQGARSGLEGACYCRAGGHLECLGQFTERECTRRCQEALCDDWFWLERRPCWNWGYGG
jgi:hypothetical protein